jgi:hypothetical protein
MSGFVKQSPLWRSLGWRRGCRRSGTVAFSLLVAEEVFSNAALPDTDVRLQTLEFAEAISMSDAVAGHLFVRVGNVRMLNHFTQKPTERSTITCQQRRSR